ncbi:hypothetical protein IWW54_005365 [Coemansia sp. RSA 2705]|nr:hypothetical protein IWW54_005365 [Coemansia sp. RSA 2705]
MSSAAEVLTTLVVHEAQIVTYRRLSRELQVHVNTAKQLLAEFHAAHADRCQAAFLVTDSKKNGTELGVRLVPEAELEAAQTDLDNIHCHVYSVGPRVEVTKQAMVMANIQAGCMRDIAELCPVASSVTRLVDAKHAPAPALPLAPEPERKPAVKIEPPPQPAKEEASPPSKSFFGRSSGTKKAPMKVSETQSSEDSTPAVKTEGHAAQPTAKDHAAQPTSDESPAQPESDESSGSEDRPRVEDMFIDDDGDSSSVETPVKTEEQGPDSQAMDTQGDSGRPSKVASDEEMADADDDDSGMHESPAALADESQASSGRRRVRKRRKVSKVKHTKNSRGMLVSQAVDEWESYSESESDPEAKPQSAATKRGSAGGPKPAAAKKPADKAKGKAVPQRSILSFFGKK